MPQKLNMPWTHFCWCFWLCWWSHFVLSFIKGSKEYDKNMWRFSRGYLAFHTPQIARFRFMFFSCWFVSKEGFYKNCPKLDHRLWPFSAFLPDFLGEINRFSLIFSFRVNLEQNVIETKIFAGKFYTCWKKSLFNYLY